MESRRPGGCAARKHKFLRRDKGIVGKLHAVRERHRHFNLGIFKRGVDRGARGVRPRLVRVIPFAHRPRGEATRPRAVRRDRAHKVRRVERRQTRHVIREPLDLFRRKRVVEHGNLVNKHVWVDISLVALKTPCTCIFMALPSRHHRRNYMRGVRRDSIAGTPLEFAILVIVDHLLRIVPHRAIVLPGVILACVRPRIRSAVDVNAGCWT